MSLSALRHIKRYCTLNRLRGGWHLSGRWVAAPWELNYVEMEERWGRVSICRGMAWKTIGHCVCLGSLCDNLRLHQDSDACGCERPEAGLEKHEERNRGSYRRRWLHARHISSTVTDIFEPRRSIKSAVQLFALAASRDWQCDGSFLLFYLFPEEQSQILSYGPLLSDFLWLLVFKCSLLTISSNVLMVRVQWYMSYSIAKSRCVNNFF